MSREPNHWHYGTPMSEWIQQIPNELPMDAVGMWNIVPAGRKGFKLEGAALTDFVRRSVAELLRRGAVPVVGGADKGFHWIRQPHYGSKPEEIVENVVREWLAHGAKDEDPGGLWFALPEKCTPIT